MLDIIASLGKIGNFPWEIRNNLASLHLTDYVILWEMHKKE